MQVVDITMEIDIRYYCHQMWWENSMSSMHALIESFTFFYNWHQSDMYARHCISLQFYSFGQPVSLLEVCWICQLFILCYNFQQRVILWHLQFVPLLWICIYLSHIQHYYLQQHVLFKIIVTSYTYIIKFTKCLITVILLWIHMYTRSVDDKITVWGNVEQWDNPIYWQST